MAARDSTKDEVETPDDGHNGETVFDEDETSETVPVRYTTTSYGADYPVDGLVQRLKAGDIIIPTFDPEVKPGDDMQGFQRQFVWSPTQSDRFIESLLLGLPVPGIFLVRQEDGRFLVLDAQQRLRSLRGFFDGVINGKEFILKHVQEQYKGKKYDSLDIEDRRRINDSIIHATIVRQDDPSGDMSSIYSIFERLNTGGTLLQPQEVRVALYHGPLVELLRELNNLEQWRSLYGRKNPRLKDQELILRFIALLYWHEKYKRPMKGFLNDYLEANRKFQMNPGEEITEIFKATTEVAVHCLGARAFRLKNALNAAVFDSMMVALAKRLRAKGPIGDGENLRRKYRALLADPNYLHAVERAIADEENVNKVSR